MINEAVLNWGSVADWGSAIANALLALIAGIGGFVAYKEYSNAQKWKRLEFAAQHLERFWSDPKIEACCIFLDWEARRMKVPEAYGVFTESKHFVHTHAQLRSAMNSSLEKDLAQSEAGPASEETSHQFKWQEVMYRDYFDRLFDFLAQSNNSLRMGILKPQDLEQLVYWLSKILAEHKDMFEQFLTKYKYEQVAELFKRISKSRT